MEKTDVDAWLEGYLRAWETNDPEDIGRLFTEEARYYTAPHREPWKGRDGIVEGWIDRKDTPGAWTFRHEVLTVAGDLAFIRGWTTYPKESEDYSNLWVIRFAPDGRCSEFTEWWMEHEKS